MDFAKFTGFEWDEGNEKENWDNHQVTKFEAEDTFFNLPLLLFFDENHSKKERRYYILGITDSSRKLQIVFTIRRNKIRVISARDMRRKGRNAYEKNT